MKIEHLRELIFFFFLRLKMDNVPESSDILLSDSI